MRMKHSANRTNRSNCKKRVLDDLPLHHWSEQQQVVKVKELYPEEWNPFDT